MTKKTEKGREARRYFTQVGILAVRQQLSLLTRRELAQMVNDEEDESEKEKLIISSILASQTPF